MSKINTKAGEISISDKDISVSSMVISAMLAMQRYPWEQGVCAQALFEAGQNEIWVAMAYD